jgi:transposase
MRYELSDYEWTAIKPMLPNKPRLLLSEAGPGGCGRGRRFARTIAFNE